MIGGIERRTYRASVVAQTTGVAGSDASRVDISHAARVAKKR